MLRHQVADVSQGRIGLRSERELEGQLRQAILRRYAREGEFAIRAQRCVHHRGQRLGEHIDVDLRHPRQRGLDTAATHFARQIGDIGVDGLEYLVDKRSEGRPERQRVHQRHVFEFDRAFRGRLGKRFHRLFVCLVRDLGLARHARLMCTRHQRRIGGAPPRAVDDAGEGR